MDPVTEQRLAATAPEFRRRATAMVERLEAEGIPVRCTRALATFAEQDALYAKGRTSPGPKVTNARAGYSKHNFGVAGDFAPMTLPHGQPDWNVTHPAWARMIEVGKECGLVSGSCWHSLPDVPHFQLPSASVTPTDHDRWVLANAGMQKYWEVAGALGQEGIVADNSGYLVAAGPIATASSISTAPVPVPTISLVSPITKESNDEEEYEEST